MLHDTLMKVSHMLTSLSWSTPLTQPACSTCWRAPLPDHDRVPLTDSRRWRLPALSQAQYERMAFLEYHANTRARERTQASVTYAMSDPMGYPGTNYIKYLVTPQAWLLRVLILNDSNYTKWTEGCEVSCHYIRTLRGERYTFSVSVYTHQAQPFS